MKTKWMMTIVTTIIAAVAVHGAAAQTEDERAQREREVEQARKELRAAAERVAELSAGMSRDVIREIHIARANFDRARLGVVVDEAADHQDGVVIAEVTEDGPAAKAGLQAGDRLLEIAGKSLAAEGAHAGVPVQRVRDALAATEPGEAVTVRYRRGRADREATVTLESFPATRFMYSGPGDAPMLMELPHIPELPGVWQVMAHQGGLELVKVGPKLGRYFGTESGLLVVRADEDNLFQLEEGDVIQSIDGRVPETPMHALRIIRSYAPGETVRLEIVRDRQRRTLEQAMPARERATSRVLSR